MQNSDFRLNSLRLWHHPAIRVILSKVGVMLRFPITRVMLSSFGMILCFPKANLPLLAYVCLLPLFLAIEGVPPKRRFLWGWLSGCLAFSGIVYWLIGTLHDFGKLPYFAALPIFLLLIVYMACFPGLFTLLYPSLKERLRVPAILIAPTLWVSLEYIRTWLFTGFPWALLGYSQQPYRHLIQITDITSVYGLSFWIVLINHLCYDLYQALWRKSLPLPKRSLIGATLALLLFLSYGSCRIGQVESNIAAAQKSLAIGLVQGNFAKEEKWDKSKRRVILKTYADLSAELAQSGTELVIWPETAVPYLIKRDDLFPQIVSGIASRLKVSLLTGFPSFREIPGENGETRKKLLNSAVLVSPEGEIVGMHDKLHLVPFGEFLPQFIEDHFPFIVKLAEEGGNFSRGEKATAFATIKGNFGVLICYDAIFPRLVKQYADAGASILVNMTNDSWFGDTSAPYQFLAITAFRAVEEKMFLLRAANTGISAVIDPTGQITARTDLFVRTTLPARIPVIEMGSFYKSYGDIFVGLVFGAGLIGCVLARLNGRKK